MTLLHHANKVRNEQHVFGLERTCGRSNFETICSPWRTSSNSRIDLFQIVLRMTYLLDICDVVLERRPQHCVDRFGMSEVVGLEHVDEKEDRRAPTTFPQKRVESRAIPIEHLGRDADRAPSRRSAERTPPSYVHALERSSAGGRCLRVDEASSTFLAAQSRTNHTVSRKLDLPAPFRPKSTLISCRSTPTSASER
jgi:hypothetical protein